MSLRTRIENRLHRLNVEAHAVWLAARDRRTPLLAQMVGIAVAGYALSPIDLIPDFVPILGLLDDLVLVSLGVWLFVKLIPDDLFAEHLAAAELASHRPTSLGGMVAILLAWTGLAALVALYLWSWQFW